MWLHEEFPFCCCLKAPCCHLVGRCKWYRSQLSLVWSPINLLHPSTQSLLLCCLSLKTTGHSLHCGSRQRRIRTQIKKSWVRRGGLFCVKACWAYWGMWNYENGLFDYLICEVCVSLSFSLIHLSLSFLALPYSFSTFVLYVSGCWGSGPGGGYPNVCSWQTQPYCFSEERWQPADTTTEQWVLQPHHTNSVFERGFPVWSSLWLCLCLFVCNI